MRMWRLALSTEEWHCRLPRDRHTRPPLQRSAGSKIKLEEDALMIATHLQVIQALLRRTRRTPPTATTPIRTMTDTLGSDPTSANWMSATVSAKDRSELFTVARGTVQKWLSNSCPVFPSAPCPWTIAALQRVRLASLTPALSERATYCRACGTHTSSSFWACHRRERAPTRAHASSPSFVLAAV